MNELVLVAKLGRTHALDGALILHDLSDFGEQFKKGAKFYLKDGAILEISSFDSEKSIVKFKSINSIQAAKRLVNAELFSTKEETKKQFLLADGEHFYFDVIGLQVSENGIILGKVKDIYEQGSNFLLEISTDSGLIRHFEQENNSAEELKIYEDFVQSNKGRKLSKNERKKAPKINTLAKIFYLPYVDFYVQKISDKVYSSGAYEILKQS